jgi:hypothetical protein
MRIHKVLPALLVFVAFASLVASPATACTANFAGNCSLDYSNPSTAFCVFDANRNNTNDPTFTACPGSSISNIFWDFGDRPGAPNGSAWNGTFIGHSYNDPLNLNGGATTVTMNVFCADGCSAKKQRTVIFVVLGVSGAIQMNVGWN